MSPHADLLLLPGDRTHKRDARSTVWQVTTEDGQALIIKRFEHSPVRQMLARWLGLHPAQREAKVNARMVAQGLAVAPIHARGWQPAGLGYRGWLATRYVGPSLQVQLQADAWQNGQLDAITTAVAQLVSRLIAAGWYFRDLKTSNILFTNADTPQLIDVGSARALRSAAQREKMLAMLEKTALADGMPPALWQRMRQIIDRGG